MAKFLKILLGIVVVLVLVVAAGAAYVVFAVDPNDYREEIAAKVEEQTGRELTLAGDLEMTVFPWLGVVVNDAVLGNAPGFDEEPFARVEQVEARLKLLPLFRREVEMSTVRLVGLRVHLARAGNGRTNWEDLVKKGAPPDEAGGAASGQGGGGVAALAIGGVEIRDGALFWEDRLNGTQQEIRDITLTTGAIRPGEPVDLDLGFDVRSNEPEIAGRIELSAVLTVDTAAQRYALEETALSIELSGAGVPGNALDAELEANLVADLGKDTARVDGLALSAYGVELTGEVAAQEIRTQPKAEGKIAVAEFALAELVENLGIALPEGVDADRLGNASLQAEFAATDRATDLRKLELAVAGGRVSGSARVDDFADPTADGKLEIRGLNPRLLLAAAGQSLDTADPEALTRLELISGFVASGDRVELNELSAQLDDSTLKGSASVRDFVDPAIRFELALDTLDADRYLPPPAEGEPAGESQPAAAQAGGGALPIETLRRLNVDGTLRVGQLKAYNLRSQDIELQLTADRGQLRVNPARAQLYEGRYQGNIGLDVRGKAPKLSIDEQLTGVQIGPLLRDLTGEQERITGRTQASARLTATGVEPEEVRRTLNGNAQFAFTDGALKGFNLAQIIRNAYARYKGQPVDSSAPQQTDFSELTGSATVTDGVVENRDLSMKSPLLRVSGAGTVDLPQESIDYRVQASVVGTLEGQGGAGIEELRDVTVPVKVTGRLDDPKFGIDMAALLTEQVKERAKEEVEKKIQEELGDKLPGGLKLPGGMFGN